MMLWIGRAAQAFGESKVDQLYVSIHIYHHVLWLQISVHYLLLMQYL